IAEDDPLENGLGLLLLLVGRDHIRPDTRPESRLIFGIDSPAVALHALLLPVNRDFKFVEQLFGRRPELLYLRESIFGHLFNKLLSVLAEAVDGPVWYAIQDWLILFVLVFFFRDLHWAHKIRQFPLIGSQSDSRSCFVE